MEKPKKPLWFRVLCAVIAAVVCVSAGIVCGATWSEGLLFGLPGGVLLGLSLARLTWWDAMFGIAESL
jgi:uncharacterized membrane protein